MNVQTFNYVVVVTQLDAVGWGFCDAMFGTITGSNFLLSIVHMFMEDFEIKQKLEVFLLY